LILVLKNMYPTINAAELRKIDNCIKGGLKEVETSLDLGLTNTKVKLNKEGFYYKGKLIKIGKVREKDKSCYITIKNKLQKMQFFSDGLLYKLNQTDYKPIMQISGTPMHKKSFSEMLEKEKFHGKVLDSGTGIGYSAIIASRSAKQVITVEMDKHVLELAKLNPYSQELFKNKNIKQIIGDITKEIKKFKYQEFDFIIFDAGTPKSSAEFFSLNNYKEACRVLKIGGRLYHYLPKHHIMRGRDFGGEVIKRMKLAGFKDISRNFEGSYVIMEKL